MKRPVVIPCKYRISDAAALDNSELNLQSARPYSSEILVGIISPMAYGHPINSFPDRHMCSL